MRISDWSSNVFSSDLQDRRHRGSTGDLDGRSAGRRCGPFRVRRGLARQREGKPARRSGRLTRRDQHFPRIARGKAQAVRRRAGEGRRSLAAGERSEEHTSELQSLMRISYAVFCLKKKKQKQIIQIQNSSNQ